MKTSIYIVIIFFGFFIISCQPNRSERKSTQRTDTIADASQEQTDLEESDFLEQVQAYESPERSNWQNPELVLNNIRPVKDMVVADIGAGTGYFTFPLLEDSAKKVIAIDIDQRFLDFIEERKLDYPDTLAVNLETRLTSTDIPSLQDDEADKVLLVNVYAYLQDRTAYMKKVKSGMRQSGMLLVVDYKRGKFPVGPPDEIKVDANSAVQELERAGFSIEKVDKNSLQYQYMIIAKNE